jgi:hyperosmotically inducible periplasmic protein
MKTLILLVLAGGLCASAQNAPTVTTRQATPPAQPVPASQQPSTATPVIPGVNDPGKGPMRGDERISREVRHELLMLPYYSVFDDLRYSVSNGSVQLTGEVNDGALREEAEKSVKRIEGVTSVTNNIQVLPPSPMDDRLRREVARSVFNAGGLSRYGWEAAPSIHVIVKNGHVRLVGVVGSEGDKDLAGMQARQVPGVLGDVSNELVVAR